MHQTVLIAAMLHITTTTAKPLPLPNAVPATHLAQGVSQAGKGKQTIRLKSFSDKWNPSVKDLGDPP